MMQVQVSPPAPPSPVTPQVPAPPSPPPPGSPAPQAMIDGQPLASFSNSPADVYQGLRAQRNVLGDQLEQLEQRRAELSEQLQNPMVTGADRAGIEQRISSLDGRIASVEQQIASSESQIAAAAGVPGATVEPPSPPRPDDGDEEGMFFGGAAVGLGIALAVAAARRRLRRRRGIPAQASAQAQGEVLERLNRLEQSVDSVAVEVERIGEGQRFMTNFFTEKGGPRAIGGGALEPVDVGQREAERVRR